MIDAIIPWRWLGRVPYGEALERQREHRDAILSGEAAEELWLLEHDPVVTVGRRPAPGTPSEEALAARGVGFFRTERGGLATWHGPGQLVAYALVDAGARGLGARGTVCALEQGVIDWLATCRIEGRRRAGWPGVWIGDAKVCAVGLHFRRGVSMHGIALNLDPDLDGFDLIVPCGIAGGRVTTVARVAGSAPAPEAAAPEVGRCLLESIRHVSIARPRHVAQFGRAPS